MTVMARRPASPSLIGRDRELAELLAAVDEDDPDRPVVLVSGEAGIGKTRLLGELVDRLKASRADDDRPRWAVARGSCLRLSEGELPFAPFLEILDEIRALGLVESIEPLRARLAGTAEATDAVRSATTRSMRFVELHDALVAAAGDRRLLVVLDDLHWADQSTLDLVLFLARRLRGSPVTLIGAFRSDELHRRHPLRPVVAEVSRGYVRERIELGPLDRAAVAQQVAALGDVAADAAAEIAIRSDGNPFYVEELVALGPGSRGIPASLRDVLLARLAVLDETTARVIAASAVMGDKADAELIGAVTGLEPNDVDRALRAAVDHWILAPDPNGRDYRFRHALLEEAALDDLLPGDRVDLHRKVAIALQSGNGAVPPGELARHLDASGQHAAAIDAYLEAAATSFRALAWAEGIGAFERAAELAATGRGGADDRSGSRLQDLVIPAALAMSWTGAPSRSIAVLGQWIELKEADGDRETAASLWMALSMVLNDVGQELEARAAVDAAVLLRPPDNTTHLGVEILLGLANRVWIEGRNRLAGERAEQALAGAETLGDMFLLFRALVTVAATAIAMGHIDRGMAHVDRALRLEAEHGWLDVAGWLPTNVGIALADQGELETARRLWVEGLRVSGELGIAQSWDPWNLPGLAVHAFHTGRWSQADGPIETSRAFHAPGMPTYFNEHVAALLAAGRGALATCDEAIATAARHVEGLPGGEFESALALARAARADAADDPGTRLDEAEAGLRPLEGLETFGLRSRLATEAASAAADLVATLHPKRDRVLISESRARARAAADLAVAIDDGTAIPGTASVRFTRANAALASAEAARAEGAEDPAAWPPIASAFRDLEMLPRVAYAQFRGAAAALASGDRPSGERLLREASSLAVSIGMTVLARRVEGLARAARIDVTTKPAPPGPPSRTSTQDSWGLSAREREVLALLADGRTNGEIGARLFISTKTASVHVTHILDKLGVSTRTEAALLASRSGLLEGPLPPQE